MKRVLSTMVFLLLVVLGFSQPIDFLTKSGIPKTMRAYDSTKVADNIIGRLDTLGGGIARALRIGTPVPFLNQKAIFFGNSVTAQHLYSAPVCEYLGVTMVDSSIAGTTLHDFHNRYTSIPNVTSATDSTWKYFFLDYGINDAESYSPVNFALSLAEAIDTIVNRGWSLKKIVIITPNYVGSLTPKGTALRAHVDSAIAVAKRKGVIWTNTYYYMRDNGGSALLQPDTVHPSVYGGLIMTKTVLAALDGAADFSGSVNIERSLLIGNKLTVGGPTIGGYKFEVTGSTNITSNTVIGGTLTVQNSIAGNYTHSFRNLSNNSGAFTSIRLGNDVSTSLIQADVFSSTWVASGGDDLANGARLFASGVNGLSFRVSNASGTMRFYSGSTERFRLHSNGNVGINQNAPTALLHIGPGGTGVGGAPLKFTSNAPTTSPEAGALQYNNGIWIMDSSSSKRDSAATRDWVRQNTSSGGGSYLPISNPTYTGVMKSPLTTGYIPYIGFGGEIKSNINFTRDSTSGSVAVQSNYAGNTSLTIRNSNNGSAGRSELAIGNDATASLLTLDGFGSGWSSSGGDDVPNGIRFFTGGVGGLSFRANSGTMRFYGGATERLRIDNSTGNLGIANSLYIGAVNTTPTAYWHTKAGTATAGTAPEKKTITGAVLNTVPEPGAREVDAGGLPYYTGTTGERGVEQVTQFITTTPATGYTLTSSISAQKMFNATTNGQITVASNKTYYLECNFYLNGLSSTSGQFGFGLNGTAVITDVSGIIIGNKVVSTGSPNSSSYTTVLTGTGIVGFQQTVTNANTNTFGFAKITAIIRVSTGGTIIPMVSITQLATPNLQGYFKITPLGSDTVTSVGNWN